MPNRFKNVLSAAKQRGEEDEPEAVQSAQEAQAREEGPPKGRGRQPGKRSDPDYTPTTVFLKKATLAKARVALIEQSSAQDVSDVLQELLEEWVEKNKKD